MLFYLSVITISSLLAGMANTQKNRSRITYSILFFLSAVTMFVPLAMRDVGVDYEEYIRGYLGTAVGWDYFWRSYLGRPEPLYVVLNFLARWIFGSFQGVNFLCAMITIGFTFAGINRIKDITNLGTTIWSVGFIYYIFMYGLNRMMISVAIITWAFQYYFSKKAKIFIFWSIVAGLFHYAALLMIAFYFVLRWMEGRSYSFKTIKWGRVIISVTAILVLIYRVVPTVFGGFYWFVRYSNYFTLSFTPAALNNNAPTFLLLILLILYRNGILEYLNDKKPMMAMMILYVVLSVSSIILPIHRITYYFYPICAILYGTIPASKVLSKENAVAANMIYTFFIVVMGIIWLYLTLETGDLWAPYLVPYKWGSF